MRITLIGPAHPWRGGIPLLTNELAHRLTGLGHHVAVRTWSRQGPARLLPAQRHPLTVPEADSFPTVAAPLSWRNPGDWWRTGHAVTGSDLVVLLHYVPVQAPAMATIARVAGRSVPVVVICANVVPHEPRPGDRALTAAVLRAGTGVLVHTPAEGAAARRLTRRPVAVAALPPHLPSTPRSPVRLDKEPKRRLLFFGKVRRYKGVDVLLQALTRTADVELSIVGEFYEDAARLRRLIAELELTDRVQVSPEYLPAQRIPELFAGFDALVLPYRTATASQLVALAHWHGLPVVATTVGNFPETVRDGVDGLLCAPDDVAALTAALHALYAPGTLRRLRTGIRPEDAERIWARYLGALWELGARSGATGSGRPR